MLALLNGAGLTAGLIISFGPQNIELIRLGLLKQKAYLMASIFVICDIILVLSGSIGGGSIIASQTTFLAATKYGASFILYYLAYQALQRMYRPITLEFNQDTKALAFKNTMYRGLLLSLFNPLVILETIIIVGGTSAQYLWPDKIFFIAGSLFVSFVWFYGIAFCTKYFSLFFKNPKRQQILEGIISVILIIMATILLINKPN